MMMKIIIIIIIIIIIFLLGAFFKCNAGLNDISHLILFDSMWHNFSWTSLQSFVSKWLKSHFVAVIRGCLLIQVTIIKLKMSIGIIRLFTVHMILNAIEQLA